MTAERLRALQAEVRADASFVRIRLDEACTFPAAGASIAELAYTALAMQRAYTALESLLERCILAFDGGTPTGPNSHRALLRRAALAIEGSRPALLTPAGAATAVEFLRFRHFIRHDYGAELDADQLGPLQAAIRDHRAALEGDLSALDEWITALVSAS